MTAGDLLELVGKDLGRSDWMVIDQERVNEFADVTLDHQFIHVDPDAAAATPFGGTIAHGFLTVALLPHFFEELAVRPDNLVMSLNYGFDKLRFLAPVRVGSEVRAHATVADITERGAGRYLIKYDVTVEIRGEEKPALAAEWLGMVVVA